MPNNDDFILDILNEAENNSTDISDVDSSNIELKRDEKGNLVSYDKKTGEKIGRIYEHGNDKGNIAKSFNEIIERENDERI